MLSGCVWMHQVRLGPSEEPNLIGPPVRDNRTPMDPALTCFAQSLAKLTCNPVWQAAAKPFWGRCQNGSFWSLPSHR